MNSPLPTRDVLGVTLFAGSLSDAARVITQRGRLGAGGAVEFMAAHNFVLAYDQPEFRHQLNHFDLIFPDGAPVVWSMNRSLLPGPAQRITARETLLEVCQIAARDGLPIYLYGSTELVVTKLANNLRERFPTLEVVGCEPSVFRALTSEENRELIARINASGAALLFLGLGCPLQERFASVNRHEIQALQLCVGSAFKFLAGEHPMPPQWIQRIGMEWLFRLCLEPRRLWRRYLFTNLRFMNIISTHIRA